MQPGAVNNSTGPSCRPGAYMKATKACDTGHLCDQNSVHESGCDNFFRTYTLPCKPDVSQCRKQTHIQKMKLNPSLVRSSEI